MYLYVGKKTIKKKNFFAEIAPSRTVFEIQAFLCFVIFAKTSKNSKWWPFLAGQKFFENWAAIQQRYPHRVKNFIEIALSSMVFNIQAFLCFALLKKIRKFKMAAIFGE